MAKIDVTQIEGYETMTAEEKLKALEEFDVPDPDYSGFVKKEQFDKAASELATAKKQLREKMTEDEAAKQKEKAPAFTGPTGDPGTGSEKYTPPKIF